MAPTRANRTGDSVDDSAVPGAPRPVDARAEAAAAKSDREIKKLAAKAAKAAKAARRDIINRLTDVAIEAKAKSRRGTVPHKFWDRLIAPYQDAEYAITKDVIKCNVRRKMARARVAGEGTAKAARASRRDTVKRLTETSDFVDDSAVPDSPQRGKNLAPRRGKKLVVAPRPGEKTPTVTRRKSGSVPIEPRLAESCSDMPRPSESPAVSTRRTPAVAPRPDDARAEAAVESDRDRVARQVRKNAAKAARAAQKKDIVDRLTDVAIKARAKSHDGRVPHKFWDHLIAPYQNAECAITKDMIKSNVRRKMTTARFSGEETKRGTVHVAPWPGAERKKRRRTSERADAPSTKKPDIFPALNLSPATNTSIRVVPNLSEVSVLNETNRAVASIIAHSLVDERFQSGKPNGGLKLRLDVLHSHFPFLSKEEVQDEVRRKMEERLEGGCGGEGSGASAETDR